MDLAGSWKRGKFRQQPMWPEDAPSIIELEREISGAARSLRHRSDYLERPLEALIRGKGKYGGK